jgi:hypothetical protein
MIHVLTSCIGPHSAEAIESAFPKPATLGGHPRNIEECQKGARDVDVGSSVNFGSVREILIGTGMEFKLWRRHR